MKANMKAKWLVELDLFTDTEDSLIQTIKDSGRIVKTLNRVTKDELSNVCRSYFDDDECVVFYGSLNFGKKIMKMPWVPGIYLDDDICKCTSYYPYFGDELLHKDYTMLPFGDFRRLAPSLFERYGETLYIRPNTGFKSFSGTILNKDNFDYSLSIIDFYKIESNELIIVDKAIDIKKEWRFVIVDEKVISGSLYRDWTIGPEELTENAITSDLVLLNSKMVHELCTDEKASEYAQKMAKRYNYSRAWTLDIALTKNDEYKTIEINSFSCSALYKNDLNKVVEAVSIAAEDEWKEYQI